MAVSIYKLISCRWSAAAWILKQNTCVQHPSGARSTLWCQAAVGSGYRGLYASHVQKQLLPNEADIICPSVLELFIRCLTSATKLLIPSALICRVTKPLISNFWKIVTFFLTLFHTLQMTLEAHSRLSSRRDQFGPTEWEIKAAELDWLQQKYSPADLLGQEMSPCTGDPIFKHNKNIHSMDTSCCIGSSSSQSTSAQHPKTKGYCNPGPWPHVMLQLESKHSKDSRVAKS